MSIDQNTLRRRGTGLIAHDPGRSYGGYTLYTPITSAGEIHLVDIEGRPVHTWNSPHPPGRQAQLLPNGNLFYAAKDTAGPTLFPIWDVYHGGIFQELAPDSTVVREARHPSTTTTRPCCATGTSSSPASSRCPPVTRPGSGAASPAPRPRAA
ncbi:hypothetical protein ACFWSF_04210 [Streptomyces sp. NPDC058611]|uniref:hypothetical protein n=1 Tax=unclassified Streptomyces TaxID=2593676 RepID=UPI00365EC719